MVDTWPSRRGPFLQWLTHYVVYDVPQWMLLEQTHVYDRIFVFHQILFVILFFKQCLCWLLISTSLNKCWVEKCKYTDISLKGGVLLGEGCSVTAIVRRFWFNRLFWITIPPPTQKKNEEGGVKQIISKIKANRPSRYPEYLK
jgi:hypothetical protein